MHAAVASRLQASMHQDIRDQRVCPQQVSMQHGNVQSTANVTDIHEALHFDQLHGRPEHHQRYSSFGIWSLRWSNDGREIIAGTGDSCVYIFDVGIAKVTG